MLGHLRANLWLFILTLLLCSVAYPLVLLGAGQVFSHQADGSLVLDRDGKPIGSELIAQPFTDDAPEYFQSRPSAASYNGAASGASNWGASQPLLRDRVARQLGPIVTYQDGTTRAGPEVQDWFLAANDRLAQWAAKYPALAQNWVKQDQATKDFVEGWSKDHAQAPEYVAWRKDNPDTTSPEPADLAGPFFASLARAKPRTWLTLDDKNDEGKPLLDKDGKPYKRVKLVEVKAAKDEENSEVQGYFFDFWLQSHPEKASQLEPVPSDMVMASGSGLDPHITLDNARWQLKHRIAAKRAEKLLKTLAAGKDENAVRRQVEAKAGKPLADKLAEEIEAILQQHKSAPLGGLAGVDLVNVLEINRAVDAHMEVLAKSLS